LGWNAIVFSLHGWTQDIEILVDVEETARRGLIKGYDAVSNHRALYTRDPLPAFVERRQSLPRLRVSNTFFLQQPARLTSGPKRGSKSTAKNVHTREECLVNMTGISTARKAAAPNAIQTDSPIHSGVSVHIREIHCASRTTQKARHFPAR
jgi:DNA-binding Lrp family transcriptional regulator